MSWLGGSPTPNHFLLFVQKKVIKENHTLRPWLSATLRDSSSKASAELAQKTWAQTVLDENSFIDCVVPVLGMPTKCPLFHSDLGVIGVAQGERKPAKHHRHSDESRNPATLFPRPLRD